MSQARNRVASLSLTRKVIMAAVVAGLIVGLLFAPIAYDATVESSPDRVAVIPISGTIDGANAQDVTERLVQAREDPNIQAVVLVIDSTGGLATAGEEIFIQVDRTAQEMPVTAVIRTAGASAAYKASLPAHEIHATPSSFVGSVGAILIRPDPIDPIDIVITTGPDKMTGDTPRGFEQGTSIVGNSFSELVMEYRHGELELSQAEIEQAKIYTGIEGAELGLIDEVGDVQGAIDAAADRADLDNYVVERLDYRGEVRFLDQSVYASVDHDNKTLVGMDHYIASEGDRVMPVALMIPHAAIGYDDIETIEAETSGNVTVETGGESDG